MLAVALVVLATYRLTRLITADAFPPLAAARAKVADRFGEDSAWAYLAECPWCVSVYAGAIVTAATDLAGVPLEAPVLVWAASSALTGILSVIVDRLEG